MTLPDLIAATALANQTYVGDSWHADSLGRAAVVCAPGWALAESYRKDAERYRWLRDRTDEFSGDDEVVYSGGPAVLLVDCYGDRIDRGILTGASLDHAVDTELSTHGAGVVCNRDCDCLGECKAGVER